MSCNICEIHNRHDCPCHATKEEKLPCGHTEAEHLESGCVGHFEEEGWEKEFDELFATDYDLAYVAQIKHFIKSRFIPKERVEKTLPEEKIIHSYMKTQGEHSTEYCEGWNDYRMVLINALFSEDK